MLMAKEHRTIISAAVDAETRAKLEAMAADGDRTLSAEVRRQLGRALAADSSPTDEAREIEGGEEAA